MARLALALFQMAGNMVAKTKMKANELMAATLNDAANPLLL